MRVAPRSRFKSGPRVAAVRLCVFGAGAAARADDSKDWTTIPTGEVGPSAASAHDPLHLAHLVFALSW